MKVEASSQLAVLFFSFEFQVFSGSGRAEARGKTDVRRLFNAAPVMFFQIHRLFPGFRDKYLKD
ncbi:hypothetical protein ACSAZK_10460 [Methanosarcina sp. Mfa9]|uniref:hypothetical protein n=1 Tax=Methanosarcina sp. Mfa9 TaxID=3439063 RepID=UPI003F861C58